MILGELSFQRWSAEYPMVRDEALGAYLNKIGDRLIKHLPPTSLKFKFLIIDIPGSNAFNGPGGYVFLSRKLIASVRNEDELAGVMAHELGHAVSRHGTSYVSVMLKKILNVTQVGDRKDIREKYNLLMERERTRNVSTGEGHETAEQLEADQIGLFAMTASGYDPEAFATFFDRLVEANGDTGSWFSETFGRGNPAKKRLREMIKLAKSAPVQCRESARPVASETFLKWQAEVVSHREANIREELPGLIWKKDLAPKLRSDISHFAFSQDGNHLLAQDDFSITILQRDPLQVLFQIPTSKAEHASFTPDGEFVVFGTENLRFEKWSIAERKPVEMRELAVRNDCWEHEFSPDGKYLACVDYSLGLNVVDTQTSKKVFEQKGFYQLSFWEYFGWTNEPPTSNEDRANLRLFNIEFSPDSRYLAVSRSDNQRYKLFYGELVAEATPDTLTGIDLNTLKAVKTGEGLNKVTRRPFLFLDSNRLLIMAPQKVEEGGIFSFPEGKRLTKFPLRADEISRTENADYVIIKPLANAKLGVLDLKRNAIVSSMNHLDVTFWKNLIVYESVAGELLLSEVSYDESLKDLTEKKLGSVQIPVGLFGRPSAADISDNFQWLAISSKTRGGVWDLNSGERKIYVRGFRGALLADSGAGILDFPKADDINHTLVRLNAPKNEAQNWREVPEKGARQFGRFLFLRASLNEPKKKSEQKEGNPQSEEDETATNLASAVRYQVFDLVQNKAVWSEEYPKEAPRYFLDQFTGRLILYWKLRSDGGKQRLKANPAIAARAAQMGNKDDDYLIEIVDAIAGKPVGSLLIETGKGSFDIESGFSEGDWLTLQDNSNRTLVYSIKNGELRHRFFGTNASMNPTGNQLVVENLPGELTFYNLRTGESEGRLVFRNSAVLVRFSLDGKKLVVVTSGQAVHAFDVAKLATKAVAER